MGFIVGAILAVVAAAVSTWQAVEAREQQADEMRTVAKQKKNEAEAARDAAAFEEGQARRRNALLLGKQRAIFAAAGVDPGVGTPLFQDIDFVKQAELEALNIRAVGAQQSASSMFERNIAKYRRQTAKAGIPLTIAGGVVQAGAGVAGAYSASGSSVLSSWNSPSNYSTTSSGFSARRVR